MNMVQKRDLIGKSEKLAIIIITLLEVTYLMVKFGVYEVKTIYTMIIIVFILTMFFVYLNVPPLLMSLLFFIRSKVILTNTTPTDTTHIETTTTDIPHIETTPMDIITETTHIETISMDTTPMYTHTNTTTTDTAPIETTHTETIDNNINNTYIKVDSTNKDNFLGNKNKNKEKNKLNIAEKYIIETFTGLCSEEEIKNIYAAIKAYSNGETDFLNYSSISVKNLKVLDLYHFGWNIWNHFRVGEQDVIAKLLKIIFAEKFSRTSIKTIKSHLKDDEKKGRIIIKEDLSKLNE
jgi:hypothetical protein